MVAAWQASPLADLGHWQLIALAALVLPVIAVTFNVIDQLVSVCYICDACASQAS